MIQDDFGKSVTAWWYKLQHDDGDRSRLKHQSDITGIESVECFYDLVRAVGWEHASRDRIDDLARVAMVLSHVESDGRDSVARLMGKQIGEIKHKVSEIRFNRLVASDLREMSRSLITILPMIDNTANVESLAWDLLLWDNEDQKKKREWLNDYYLSGGN